MGESVGCVCVWAGFHTRCFVGMQNKWMTVKTVSLKHTACLVVLLQQLMLNGKFENTCTGKGRTCHGGDPRAPPFCVKPYCEKPCCEAHYQLLQCISSDGHVTMSL